MPNWGKGEQRGEQMPRPRGVLVQKEKGSRVRLEKWKAGGRVRKNTASLPPGPSSFPLPGGGPSLRSRIPMPRRAEMPQGPQGPRGPEAAERRHPQEGRAASPLPGEGTRPRAGSRELWKTSKSRSKQHTRAFPWLYDPQLGPTFSSWAKQGTSMRVLS